MIVDRKIIEELGNSVEAAVVILNTVQRAFQTQRAVQQVVSDLNRLEGILVDAQVVIDFDLLKET
jgi:hypothetical protein